jgi:hypothetical protein
MREIGAEHGQDALIADIDGIHRHRAISPSWWRKTGRT